MAEDLQPDPPLIGGVPMPQSALLPEPVKLVQKRTELRRHGFTPYFAGY